MVSYISRVCRRRSRAPGSGGDSADLRCACIDSEKIVSRASLAPAQHGITKRICTWRTRNRQASRRDALANSVKNGRRRFKTYLYLEKCISWQNAKQAHVAGMTPWRR